VIKEINCFTALLKMFKIYSISDYWRIGAFCSYHCFVTVAGTRDTVEAEWKAECVIMTGYVADIVTDAASSWWQHPHWGVHCRQVSALVILEVCSPLVSNCCFIIYSISMLIYNYICTNDMPMLFFHISHVSSVMYHIGHHTASWLLMLYI